MNITPEERKHLASLSPIERGRLRARLAEARHNGQVPQRLDGTPTDRDDDPTNTSTGLQRGRDRAVEAAKRSGITVNGQEA